MINFDAFVRFGIFRMWAIFRFDKKRGDFYVRSIFLMQICISD